MNWELILITLISSGTITALINLWQSNKKTKFNDLTNIQNDLTLLKTALRSQMRERLRQKYYESVRIGFVSIEDREDFESMYQQYHALGGNGYLTRCYEQYMNLPIADNKKD